MITEHDPHAETPHLTYDQAVAMLPEGDTIHTFVQPCGVLIGADLSRERVLDLLRTGDPQMSGPQATAMGHGIVADVARGSVFIETVPGSAPDPAAAGAADEDPRTR